LQGLSATLHEIKVMIGWIDNDGAWCFAGFITNNSAGISGLDLPRLHWSGGATGNAQGGTGNRHDKDAAAQRVPLACRRTATGSHLGPHRRKLRIQSV
jgi:hypothetical protein